MQSLQLLLSCDSANLATLSHDSAKLATLSHYSAKLAILSLSHDHAKLATPSHDILEGGPDEQISPQFKTNMPDTLTC